MKMRKSNSKKSIIFSRYFCKSIQYLHLHYGKPLKTEVFRGSYNLIFFILSCFLFFSCAQKKPTVGIFVYQETDPYMFDFSLSILDSAKLNFETQLYFANNSQVLQNEQIEKALKKVDIFLINPVDRLGAFALIKKIKTTNKPVIFFNREPLERDLSLYENAYYVGAKPEQSGELQATLIMNLFGNNPQNLNHFDRNQDGKIQIFILKGEQGHQDAEARTNAVLQTFADSGWIIDLLDIEIANWNRDEAYTKTGRFLSTHPNQTELIISNNDDMALGAIARLRQENYFKDSNQNGKIDQDDQSWIPVVGVDGLTDARESINSGYLYGTVINNSPKMAKLMIELSEILLKLREASTLSIPITENKYLWIDYEPFISIEESFNK